MEQVNAVIRYVYDGLKEVREVKKRESKGEAVDRQELAARLLTPSAFKKFFKEMKAAEMVAEPIAWQGVVCPAKSTGELICPGKYPARAMV